MKPSKHVLLATVTAFGLALVAPAMAEGLATKKTGGEAKDKWIVVESMPQPKADSQNQMKTNNNAQPKKSGDPMPTESISLNYDKVKPAAPKGTVAPPPGKAAGADGTVDAADYVVWRKSLSQQPAGGALPAGPTDLSAKEPKETPLLLPAVQAAREAARRSPDTQKGGKDIKK